MVAAGHVLVKDNGLGWVKDLDLIFHVGSSHGGRSFSWSGMWCSLLNFLPEGVNKLKISPTTLKEAYVQKLVKVCTDADRWSPHLPLQQERRNVELKFADSIRRQFGSSAWTRSRIILDSLLSSTTARPSLVRAPAPHGHRGERVRGTSRKPWTTCRTDSSPPRTPRRSGRGGCSQQPWCGTSGPMTRMRSRPWSATCAPGSSSTSRTSSRAAEEAETYLQNHFARRRGASTTGLFMTLRRVVNESTVCLYGP